MPYLNVATLFAETCLFYSFLKAALKILPLIIEIQFTIVPINLTPQVIYVRNYKGSINWSVNINLLIFEFQL